jgi:hypothetical protein
MEWKSGFNISSPIESSRLHNLINQTLSTVSTGEIQMFLQRLDFYIEHFKIVAKKTNDISSDIKVNFLRRLRTVLTREIETRNMVSVRIET